MKAFMYKISNDYQNDTMDFTTMMMGESNSDAVDKVYKHFFNNVVALRECYDDMETKLLAEYDEENGLKVYSYDISPEETNRLMEFYEGKTIKTWRYEITTNTVWTNFDSGTVEAKTFEEACKLAEEIITRELAEANKALEPTGFHIDMDMGSMEVFEENV